MSRKTAKLRIYSSGALGFTLIIRNMFNINMHYWKMECMVGRKRRIGPLCVKLNQCEK